MKKNHLIIGASILVSAFTACNNNSHSSKVETDNLARYLDSVDRLNSYTDANWKEIDNGYQQINMKVDNEMATMSAEEKASVEASKAKYGTIKMKYETAMKEREEAAKKPDYKMVLRSNLFGEGKIGNDMSFAWVNANNIKDVYEKFVNTTDDNKDKYTREDWDEIKTLYEALDTRKNEVEKDLATRDNLKIAGLKIKFAAIKAVERPMAKVKENEDAKDK
ncbi:MAG: DUF6565 domain-containing protein [Ferruginibacter sp.]